MAERLRKAMILKMAAESAPLLIVSSGCRLAEWLHRNQVLQLKKVILCYVRENYADLARRDLIQFTLERVFRRSELQWLKNKEPAG